MTTIKEQCDKVLDQRVIDTAAEIAGRQLVLNDCAIVGLEPGDATFYRFVILPPAADVVVSHVGSVTISDSPRRHYLVTLATSFGLTYEWAGHKMHGDYCASKWASDHREWTGEVVARFLTALAAHVVAVPS